MSIWEWIFIGFLALAVCVMMHYRVDFIVILALIVCICAVAVSIRITMDSGRHDMQLKVEELLIVTDEIQRKQRNHEQRLRDLDGI